MIKPKMLKEGDIVATISSSWGGPSVFPERYQVGKKQLEDLFSVKVIESKYALKPADWLYRNPEARAEDLMSCFADDQINGIVSTIGGDESVRILPYIDIDVIKSNPKVFMGYSDTTISHLICYKSGFTSFYGPSIMSGFAENGGIPKYLENSVRKSCFSSKPIGLIEPSTGWTVEKLDWGNQKNQNIKRKLSEPTGPEVIQGNGKISGHLLGGCVEVLEMVKGTDFFPNISEWSGAIMFLETSEETPDLDSFIRWIRNYGSIGIFNVINGIILGRPGGDIPINEIDKYDKALKMVISEELGLTELPIIVQMDFGHTDPMFTIPYGIKAEIDCDNNKFSILESGVEL